MTQLLTNSDQNPLNSAKDLKGKQNSCFHLCIFKVLYAPLNLFGSDLKCFVEKVLDKYQSLAKCSGGEIIF